MAYDLSLWILTRPVAWSALDALPPSLSGRAWQIGGLHVLELWPAGDPPSYPGLTRPEDLPWTGPPHPLLTRLAQIDALVEAQDTTPPIQAEPALALAMWLSDRLATEVLYIAANDDGLDLAALAAKGELRQLVAHGEGLSVAANASGLVQVTLHPPRLFEDDEEDGEEDDEELVAFGEALKADLAALPEVLVRHGDRVPDSVMHSAALALWPAEAPLHAPLGLGTFEALEGLASQAKIVWGEGMVKKPWWRFW
jgi:hypothetical protein